MENLFLVRKINIILGVILILLGVLVSIQEIKEGSSLINLLDSIGFVYITIGGLFFEMEIWNKEKRKK